MIRFRVEGARAEKFAAGPTVTFTLGLDEPHRRSVKSLLLQAVVRVEPARRRYEPGEQARLSEIFGASSARGAGSAYKPLLVAEVSRVVPAFDGTCSIDLAIPCTYDLDVAATRYFQGLEGGAIPLSFLFRGTVFFSGAEGMNVEMLPWDREASFDLPLATWREAMDAFFPRQGWLRLDRDVIDALIAFKAARAYGSWDDVMRDLLARREGGVP